MESGLVPGGAGVERTGANSGLVLPPLPSLTPASQGHSSFFFNLLLVFCWSNSTLKKKGNVLSLSSVHNGVLMAGISEMVVVGAAWLSCAPYIFSQRAGVYLKDDSS